MDKRLELFLKIAPLLLSLLFIPMGTWVWNTNLKVHDLEREVEDLKEEIEDLEKDIEVLENRADQQSINEKLTQLLIRTDLTDQRLGRLEQKHE